MFILSNNGFYSFILHPTDVVNFFEVLCHTFCASTTSRRNSISVFHWEGKRPSGTFHYFFPPLVEMPNWNGSQLRQVQDNWVNLFDIQMVNFHHTDTCVYLSFLLVLFIVPYSVHFAHNLSQSHSLALCLSALIPTTHCSVSEIDWEIGWFTIYKGDTSSEQNQFS